MDGSGEGLLMVAGGVAIVTLNALERHNALTPEMAYELIATFDEVDATPKVGALVIRPVGKSFWAGGDVATLLEAGKDPAAPQPYEGMGKIYDSIYRLGQVKVPTVAAVRGSAAGPVLYVLRAADKSHRPMSSRGCDSRCRVRRGGITRASSRGSDPTRSSWWRRTSRRSL